MCLIIKNKGKTILDTHTYLIPVTLLLFNI
ncbi:hypothetical protein MAQ5080_00380 [Marinomonas aquimarina]|uniref:Uncharacterized protein n=1 Tax=Marinomonas aquimarina TaxID=295068 RepID=A0A1A8T415_9GAMM|nr:hypothetical protein MAQ5080_00380 [Marinomonas aquimarina]